MRGLNQMRRPSLWCPGPRFASASRRESTRSRRTRGAVAVRRGPPTVPERPATTTTTRTTMMMMMMHPTIARPRRRRRRRRKRKRDDDAPGAAAPKQREGRAGAAAAPEPAPPPPLRPARPGAGRRLRPLRVDDGRGEQDDRAQAEAATELGLDTGLKAVAEGQIVESALVTTKIYSRRPATSTVAAIGVSPSRARLASSSSSGCEERRGS